MILVFDLDDVLYNESCFVKSGFLAVANYLQKTYSIRSNNSVKFMEKKFQVDRRNIFDELLKKYEIYDKKTVKKCLSVYRSHHPKISLYIEAIHCLKRFMNYPLYIVTDGNKMVQKNKIMALGLNKMVKSFILTSNYGLKNSKPSPYCFLKICEKEKVRPKEVVYIGDNPQKDFVGIKPQGFKTIRVLKSKFGRNKVNKKYDAEFTIKSLKYLTPDLLNRLFA